MVKLGTIHQTPSPHPTREPKRIKVNVAYSVGSGLELTVPKAESIFNAQRDIIRLRVCFSK